MDIGIVIIGAEQAGSLATLSLRQLGCEGSITLIGAESPPYQRPPLSKAYLKGDLTVERLLHFPSEFYEKQNIQSRLGERVIPIDPSAKSITPDKDKYRLRQAAADNGRAAAPFANRGCDLPGIYCLRTAADSGALRSFLSA